jgi:hypothetical protein
VLSLSKLILLNVEQYTRHCKTAWGESKGFTTFSFASQKVSCRSVFYDDAYNPLRDEEWGIVCSPSTLPERVGRGRRRATVQRSWLWMCSERTLHTIAGLTRKGARVVPVASVEEAAPYGEADYRIIESGSGAAQD